VIDIGIADVACHKRRVGPKLSSHRLRDVERSLVERFKQMLLPDEAHLLAMSVVRKRLDDVGARSHEVTMDLRHYLGMLEDDFGNEAASLKIAAPFELEEVPLGADDASLGEAL
jgi:hypothetical protein